MQYLYHSTLGYLYQLYSCPKTGCLGGFHATGVYNKKKEEARENKKEREAWVQGDLTKLLIGLRKYHYPS
jgi:hypothetical protein